MYQRNKCRYYDECSAPLCPMLSDEENRKGLWYPEEEICWRRKDLPDWVRQQRKVVKKVKKENMPYYFTLDMLMVPFRVTDSVRGLDSDQGDEEKQLKAWFKRNRGARKRNISDQQRERKRKSVARARRGKTRAQHTLDLILSSNQGDSSFSDNQLDNHQAQQNREA
jgi:hypothetical protein